MKTQIFAGLASVLTLFSFASGASAQDTGSYYFRYDVSGPSAPQATAPNPFQFSDLANQRLGVEVTSDSVIISGLIKAAQASAFGGEISANGGAWSNSVSVTDGTSLRVRATASSEPSTTTSVTISVGGYSTTWRVSTEGPGTANPFSFDDLTNQAPSTAITSNQISASGFDGHIPVTISGGDAKFSINGVTWSTSGSISAGQSLQLMLTSSKSSDTEVDATVTVGSTSDTWSVRTMPPQNPDSFDFVDLQNQRSNFVVSSTPATMSGFVGSLPAVVSGPTAKLRVNGGAWVTTADVIAGDTLQLQATTPVNTIPSETIVATVGNTSADWHIYLSKPDNVPTSFKFNTLVGIAQLNTVETSTAEPLTGFTGPVSATCVDGCQAIARNGVWGGTTVNGFMPGDKIAIRITTGGLHYSEVHGSVNISGLVAGPFTVLDDDVGNNPSFSFERQDDVPLNTVVESTSSPISGNINGPLSAYCGQCLAIGKNGVWVNGQTISGYVLGDVVNIRVITGGQYDAEYEFAVDMGEHGNEKELEVDTIKDPDDD